ncbi:hypothetical protein [Actinoplanes derwentensis]|nr:hypothetical protein [Actinoplanes derwentensis]
MNPEVNRMSLATRPAVLLATATVAASLLVAPGAAWAADTTTTLTAAEMRTALRTVGTASTSAGAGGWRAVTDFSLSAAGETMTIKDTVMVDPVLGRFGEVTAVSGYGTESSFAAEGQGVWTQADTEQVKALRMMGKSAVKYVFAADKKLKLAEFVKDSAFDSASLVEYYSIPGTKTVHDDGTIDYKVTENDQKVTVLIHTTAASVLTGVELSSTSSKATVGFTYAAQTVTLPAAATVLDVATVNRGVAYLDMAATVKLAATKGAASTRAAAKGRTVKVASLRKLVRRDVTTANRAAGVTMVKVKDVSGGVRVSATNPWTKSTVTYSVKASGRKVLVKKL